MVDRFVLDASVAAKWFLRDPLEDHLEAASRVLLDLLDRTIELHAPRILSYEVGRLLWKACMTPAARSVETTRLDAEAARGFLETLFDLPLRFASATVAEATGTLERSLRFRKNYYDMAYLGLAEKLDCRVLTADEKVVRSAPPDFPRERFLMVANYPKG